jgi:hypothetical protein
MSPRLDGAGAYSQSVSVKTTVCICSTITLITIHHRPDFDGSMTIGIVFLRTASSDAYEARFGEILWKLILSLASTWVLSRTRYLINLIGDARPPF